MKSYVTMLCTVLGSWNTSSAQTPVSAPRSTAIATQPLAQALTLFAQETGLQLIYLSSEVAGASTKGAPPSLSPRERLVRLLADTGLTFEYLNERTVRIFPNGAKMDSGGKPTPAGPGKGTRPQSHTDATSAENRSAIASTDNKTREKSMTAQGLFARVAGLFALCGFIAHPGTLCAQSSAEGPPQAAVLEEVVVTARKTAESIESVPLSIQVFNPAELAQRGQQGLVDIAQLTPGFVFQTYSSAFDSSPTIRGLSQFDITSSVANVSTEVNGVYIPRNYSVDLDIGDISRIEIAKGPQSALYGSNAFAGVIGYTLAAPPTRPEAQVSVTGGNVGRFDYKLAAGDSWFDDMVAVRGYYARTRYDGTWKNLFPGNPRLGGYDNETYGGALRVKPVQGLELDFYAFQLNRHEDLKPTFNLTSSDSADSYNCAPFICGTLSYNPSTYASATSKHLPGLEEPSQPGFTAGTTFYSAQLHYDITSELKLHYIYGWVGAYATEITSAADDPLNPGIGINYNSFATTGCLQGSPSCNFDFGAWDSAYKEGGTNQLGSHEIRLEWNHGPLKALLGAYLSNDTDNYAFGLGSFAAGSALTGDATVPFDFNGFDFPLLGQVRTTKSTAVFGRVGYDFLDGRANVAGELRHSKDEVGSIASTSGELINAPAADIVHRGASFDDTTPRVTLSYKLTPNELVYASAAQGVKQAGYNPLSAGALPIPLAEQTFGPEKNWTYELGTKNTLLDGRAVVNADVFFVTWSNLQIEEQPANAVPGALVPNITVNQGGAKSKGFESDGRFAATPELELNYAFAYIDATFDRGDISGEVLRLCNGVLCPTDAAIGGDELPRYSKVQGVAGATWRQKFSTDYSWTLHGEVTYQSQQQVDETNITQIPARTLVNLNAGLNTAHWDLTFWGRNILNRKYVADAFYEPSPTSGSVGYGPSLGELATYGVTATVRLY